jgi:tetratricopeptide (TPR) repeat protein
MTRGLRPPTAGRSFSLRRAAALAALALPALGCSMLGLTKTDPMRAEMRRLEKEQRAKAVQEQLIEDAKEKERTKHPDTVEGLVARGDAHLAAGKVEAALWDYASAHQLDPEAAAPRERVGYVHLRQNPERARPLFESALEREPNSVNAHIGLGLSLLAAGERADGLRHLERAVELDPKSARAQAALGVSLDQLGRREEAVAHLEAARDLRPRDARILNNLGVAYLRSGQPERAEPLLRAALREDDRDVALRSNNLGMALAMQGRFDEALEAFRQAGDEQSARANLGYAYYTRGEYDRAIEQYEKALLAGGKANVDVVRNLEAARRAREVAQRAPGTPPRGAGPPPPVAAPRIDPGGIAGDDVPAAPASPAPN